MKYYEIESINLRSAFRAAKFSISSLKLDFLLLASSASTQSKPKSVNLFCAIVYLIHIFNSFIYNMSEKEDSYNFSCMY